MGEVSASESDVIQPLRRGRRREREAGKTGSSFGNFVFLGLRSNSGIRRQGEVDLYLRGEDGRWYLTDYNCSFVVQNGKLCSVNSSFVLVSTNGRGPTCNPVDSVSDLVKSVFDVVVLEPLSQLRRECYRVLNESDFVTQLPEFPRFDSAR